METRSLHRKTWRGCCASDDEVPMHCGAGVYRLSGDGDEGADDSVTPWMRPARVYRYRWRLVVV